MVAVIVKQGDIYGRLSIVKEVEPLFYGKNVRCFLCLCSCGIEVKVALPSLRSGNTVSCGCSHSENSAERIRQHHPVQITHGLSRHPLYNVHKNIIARCYDDENPAFKNYGGRGIYLCDKWRNSLVEFVRWAEDNGYQPGLQIDRIDNNSGYSPENCRFVLPIENSNNRRNNIKVNIDGEELSLKEAVPRFSSVSLDIVRQRIYKGWTDKEALFTPILNKKGER